MFKQAIIHYPSDKRALAQIHKEIAAFRCTATIRYIESLNLSDRQIEALYADLAADMAARNRKVEIGGIPSANQQGVRLYIY